MLPEQQRIVNDLHKGVSSLPYKQMVYNQAGDVLQLINAVHGESKRADVAEARVATLEQKLAARDADTDLLSTDEVRS